MVKMIGFTVNFTKSSLLTLVSYDLSDNSLKRIEFYRMGVIFFDKFRYKKDFFDFFHLVTEFIRVIYPSGISVHK